MDFKSYVSLQAFADLQVGLSKITVPWRVFAEFRLAAKVAIGSGMLRLDPADGFWLDECEAPIGAMMPEATDPHARGFFSVQAPLGAAGYFLIGHQSEPVLKGLYRRSAHSKILWHVQSDPLRITTQSGIDL